MTTQITVRLPDETVAFIDNLVLEGKAPSRAAAVATALRREQRRLRAEEDAKIYAAMAKEEPSEDERSYREWVKNRVIPPMEDDQTDWEAATARAGTDA
jgi:Arc/MetJ-type ribon-helix-helix transcriptional regulator